MYNPMTNQQMQALFTQEQLDHLFPLDRSRDFFEALYGDDEDAAFDIRLSFAGATDARLHFRFLLDQRPGKCLACNLTYGLPKVFSRHPVINIRGIVGDVAEMLDLPPSRLQWDLGQTEPSRPDQHAIPLTVTIQPAV